MTERIGRAEHWTNSPHSITRSRRGYEGQVLDIAGVADSGSPQHIMALAEFRRDRTITALYGFSAGGYNVLHIIDDMTKDERDRFAMAVVLGAPDNSPSLYKGPWELVYRLDPATATWTARARCSLNGMRQ